jgi:hypothetical protein
MKPIQTKFVVAALLAGLALSNPCGAVDRATRADAELFEFYDEALRLFNAVPLGGDITAEKGKRATLSYGRSKAPLVFVRDYTDKVANDFSVRFDSPGSEEAQVIGFTPGPWIESWPVGMDAVLNIQIKADPKCGQVTLALIDANKRRALFGLTGFKADGTWHKVRVPLKDFKPEADFKFGGGIVGCEVRAAFPRGAKMWFDDIRFSMADGSAIGVTEKPIAQRMAEATQTREQRRLQPNPKPSGIYQVNAARIARGEELKEANRQLAEYFKEQREEKSYRVGFYFGHAQIHRLALDYGKFGRIAPGRLESATEQALLELVWEGAQVSDDIGNTRQNTWWLLGSENHDIAHKVDCLLTARLLSLYPETAGRFYVNAGKGNGYGDHLPELQGDGDWANDQKYTPVDHYRAWVEFFREYLRQRAKRGLFVEVRSNHYINTQIGRVSELQTYGGDEELSRLARQLQDLIWADYAQDSLSGINGGAKTRSSVRTRLADTLLPLLGGPGGDDLDYSLPPLIWKLALKRETLGEYAYLSRRPGEEEDIWPRPKGGERAQMCDTEARFLRYSWVTPDYVLGTQMDHPAAVHSHPSIVSRWTGVTFSASFSVPSHNRSGVYPYLAPKPEYGPENNKKISDQHYMDFMYHSVQDRNVLIVQQPKPMRVRHVSPKWFPTDHAPWIGKDIGVYMEDADEIAEQSGWVFVRKGNAYVAVRAILPIKAGDVRPAQGVRGTKPLDGFLPVAEDSYTWNNTRTFMQLKDPYSPIIIETGRKAVNRSFLEFQKGVLANPIRIRSLIAGAYDVIYRGSGPDAKEIVFSHDSNALPTVGGVAVNYGHPNVFESPYIFSKYNSGEVVIRRGGEELILDFSKETSERALANTRRFKRSR